MQWQHSATLPDNFITKPLRQLLMQDWLMPKHLVYSLKLGQRVLVNGAYLPVNFEVRAGDHILLTFLPTDFQTPFQNIAPDSAATVAAVYEDTNMLVVNKTPGSKTHANQPGEVGATLNHVAAYLLPKAQQPYMIHRLDQETSGALIVAKDPAVVPILVRLIKEKRIKRTYLTWVHGRLQSEHGTISIPIGRDPEDKRKRQIGGIHPQPATTHYRVIRRIADATLVAVQLQTGRTHQIRVHFSGLGIQSSVTRCTQTTTAASDYYCIAGGSCCRYRMRLRQSGLRHRCLKRLLNLKNTVKNRKTVAGFAIFFGLYIKLSRSWHHLRKAEDFCRSASTPTLNAFRSSSLPILSSTVSKSSLHPFAASVRHRFGRCTRSSPATWPVRSASTN